MSLSGLSDELAQVRTKKKEFLEQIERIVPWGRWIAMIKPCYYKGERGNKPYDLELMLRLYLLQNLYNLSDEATVAEAMDSRAFSEFCGVESSNQVPDGDTLGRFRNILVHNGLQEQLFAQVIKLLREKGLLLKKGTIVDSTIIAAPSSTKNQDKQRDPDAHQVKKGNEWHFGYKAHIGVDKDSGLVHTLKVTAANVHDVTMTSRLLTGEETAVYGDSGYLGAEKREDAIITNHSGKHIRVAVVPVLFCGGGNRALVTRPVQFYDLMVSHCALPSLCVKAFHLYRQQKSPFIAWTGKYFFKFIISCGSGDFYRP